MAGWAGDKVIIELWSSTYRFLFTIRIERGPGEAAHKAAKGTAPV